ncbi:hypothetical protein CXG81DRAFT_23934 [Caulochytrium protostelioides]|uniref:MoaB/Mog domain-containing protein n=1 Tax=Caulochytrium protostelioides TaxID=1555241 RepID=A0A4P9XD44_9FUNG|nr:hypothetical protein CXG81DRAFT_23934 [Caulochytrium protostelioides]|eukprot:RKP03407.1 hypothetical protein CXG81DRAFT_23934 [Caulochytrium protostelioides]
MWDGFRRHAGSATQCFDIGLDLHHVVVTGDDPDEIGYHVRALSERYGIVITSGGIGPTLDDVTYPSLATAFGLDLAIDQATLSRMRANGMFDRDDESSPAGLAKRRMALLPRASPDVSVEVHHPSDALWVPVVILHTNVVVLPGIPALFQALFDASVHRLIVPRLAPPGRNGPHITIKADLGPRADASDTRQAGVRQFYRETLPVYHPESSIAQILIDETNRPENHDLRIGSYPTWNGMPDPRRKDTPLKTRGTDADGRPMVRVYVTITGRDTNRVEECAEHIRLAIDALPPPQT